MTGRSPFWPPAGLLVVVTCEHASAAVPGELGDLGLPAAVLRGHRSFDEGALPIAKVLAKALQAPLHAGLWSRLVADLNRSSDHPRVVARAVDGRPVPGNLLSRAERHRRIQDYWQPYRDEASRAIKALASRAFVLHLSVHTFVASLHGVERSNDIGLLHDPDRPREVAFCEALKAPLAAAGLKVRRNFPYFGNTDGFTSWLRQVVPERRYAGIEIECNQRLARSAAGQRRLAKGLVGALRVVLG